MLIWLFTTFGIYEAPNGIVYVVLYSDAYPFLPWSKNSNNQTSIQLRILSKHNLFDVFPVARWFGEDDYIHCSTLGKKIHEQFQTTEEMKINVENNTLTIKRILCSDGKGRRG